MTRSSLALLLALAACGADPSTDPSLTLGDPTDGSTVGTEPSEPACGPVDLCSRTIDECGYAMTLDDCTGWYDNADNCADMAAYTACNCDCLEEPTCDDYFACGTICFDQHC